MIAASGYASQGQDGPGKLALMGIALEKAHYPFKNYRHARAKSVLFAGCNFPSLYPRTCKALVELLASKGGVGVAYDCCGKPLRMMGREEDFKRICSQIGARLSKRGCEELVCACPNCLYALRDNIPQRVVSVYAKLAQLGIMSAALSSPATDSSGQGAVTAAADAPGIRRDKVYFPPCPDRREGVIFADMMRYLPADVRALGCAGPHGCRKGDSCGGCKALGCCRHDLSGTIGRDTEILTACASCCGYLTAAGYGNVRMLLSDILGVEESPAMSRSLINRAKTKLA